MFSYPCFLVTGRYPVKKSLKLLVCQVASVAGFDPQRAPEARVEVPRICDRRGQDSAFFAGLNMIIHP